MNTSRLTVGAIVCLCVLLSGLHTAWGRELRCSCVRYYHGIPWTATCVYLKPKSAVCDRYELIVYNKSPTKTCVRVKNPSVFDKINEHAWFKVTNKPGTKQISLRRQNTPCSVVQ
ncbi:chemokine vCXCL5 [Cercopithecine betaherpesvirus 5]|uniref:Chemokine vCXCL5 n=1 Tax=Simian cytomegalovirus (strain Colburn) TaxID=50292 RepID=G8XU20_SCMVC|nr:chemokine vCXCL5 [Cercopithecine betaherpesvirus 5]